MVNLEVLLEQTGELAKLLLVAGLVLPAALRMEDVVGDTGASLGDRQIEDRGRLVFDLLGELTRMDRIDNGTRVAKRDSLAHTVPATNPAGVYEPDIHLVVVDAVSQHLSVLGGMPDEEGLAETSREGG